MEIPRRYLRVEQTLPLAVLAFYLVAVLLLQRLAGATSTSFGYMPDEPAHYVSSLMIHDYLRHGFPSSPLKFATSYYLHLPYFAIGYWPPGFYLLTALWMFVFGCGRGPVLGLTALITAALCFTVFYISTRWLNVGFAVLVGLLPLLVPEVAWQSCFVMVDLPVALFTLWAALAFERYVSSPAAVFPALLFSLSASAAILAKYSGAFICVLPFVMVVVLRRFDLLRRWTFWLQPALIFALCGPWIISTRALASYGLPMSVASRTGSLFLHLADFLRAMWSVAGWQLCVAAAVSFGLVLALAPARRGIALVTGCVPVLLIVFLALSPVGPEGRYLIPVVAPCCILAGLGWHVLATRLTLVNQRLIGGLILGLLLLQGAKLWRAFPHLEPDAYAKLATIILSAPQWHSSLFLAPEQGEGSFIAELAMQDSNRPSVLVARPKKILADMDWLGNSRLIRYSTPAELQDFFDNSPIDYVVLRHDVPSSRSILGRLIADTVLARSDRWQEVSRTPYPCSGTCPPWQIFHRLPSPGGAAVRDRTGWLAQREFLRLYERRPDLPIH